MIKVFLKKSSTVMLQQQPSQYNAGFQSLLRLSQARLFSTNPTPPVEEGAAEP